MSCRSFIQRYLSTLPPGSIFTTADVLIFGKRGNVDKAIQFLVKRGLIIRLARGVFIGNNGNHRIPSIKEIAKVKAKTFGKELRILPPDTESADQAIFVDNEQCSFYTDGSTSSFQYRGKTIHLRRASKRRLTMTDSKAGLAIRALWAVGRQSANDSHFEKLSTLWNLSREEKMTILQSKASMPAWIGDHFPPSRYLDPELHAAASLNKGGKSGKVKCVTAEYRVAG